MTDRYSAAAAAAAARASAGAPALSDLAFGAWRDPRAHEFRDPNMMKLVPEGLESDMPVGGAARFAGPAAMGAATLDRVSPNVRDANFTEGLINLMLSPPFRLAMQYSGYFQPAPTMQEISDLLPKQDHWPMPGVRK